jgi:hypothetical protein
MHQGPLPALSLHELTDNRKTSLHGPQRPS